MLLTSAPRFSAEVLPRRIFVTARYGQAEPHVRDELILRNTLAHAVQDPEIDLSIGIALLGSFAIPTHRDRVVLRDTLAIVVHDSEIVLSHGVQLTAVA
jgi:hypothetical protein